MNHINKMKLPLEAERILELTSARGLQWEDSDLPSATGMHSEEPMSMESRCE